MRNRITPCIMSAIILLPLPQSFSAYAENEADRGTLTVTIIDEETNELFVEDRDCFGINGGSIHLDSWNPSKSNPHTVTDVQTKFEYDVQYVGKDYDGYTYYIDTEKCDPLISFTDDTVKELTIYMKKNIWSNNNTPTEPVNTEPTEKKSFEDLYDFDENELKQYCTAHKLNFISKEVAERQIADKCGINIMVKPNNYLLSAKGDLFESEDLSAFNKSNFADYDFGKMSADLKLSEKCYKFNSEKNDFAFYAVSATDADGNLKQSFLKLAQIYVELDYSAENDRSLARLYQLACICAEQNPIVYSVSLEKIGASNIDTDKTIKGDVNNDGEFNISDVVILQKWLLAVPDTELVNWKAADLCEDDRLDVFDLCLMKKQLIEKNNDDPHDVDTSIKLQSVTDLRNNGDIHKEWKGYIIRSEKELNNIISINEGISAQDNSIEGIDMDLLNDRSLVVIYSPCSAGNSYSIINDMTIKNNLINVSTTTKSPMIATPDMLYRRYIYCIDKNASANTDNFTFNDTSDFYQYEEGNEVVKWFEEWKDNSKQTD